MHFACFRDGLRAETVFRADERKDIPEFRRVEHNPRTEPDGGTILEVNGCNRDDAIAAGLSGRHFRSQMQGDPASLDMRLEERINGGYRYLWLEGHARHPAVARIEVRVPTGIARKRPVVIAQRITQV